MKHLHSTKGSSSLSREWAVGRTLTAGRVWVTMKEESEWHTTASTAVEFDRNPEWKEHYIVLCFKNHDKYFLIIFEKSYHEG